MTRNQCAIWEKEKFMDGIQDSTATWEAGFAKIVARDAELQGKEVVFWGEMTDVKDAGFS